MTATTTVLALLAGCTAPSVEAPTTLESGTAPVQGQQYLFELSSHCGIRYLYLGGDVWETPEPWGDPPRVPDEDGPVTYDGMISGILTLTAQDTLEFREAEDSITALPEVMVFHPSDATPPLCG